MDFKSWLFEAKTRKDYEKILINLLGLDKEEGINQKLDTLDPEKLKDKIASSGELKDLGTEKLDQINKMIDTAESGDSIGDLVSIMI